MNIADVLKENKRRNELLHANCDPLTGFGSPIARFMIKVVGSFFLWLPESMKQLDIIQELLKYASISDYVGIIYGEDHISTKVSRFLNDLDIHRRKHDFEFWAFTCIKIQDRTTFQLIPFKLRKAQHKLLLSFEKQRMAGLPIRVVLDKARQWGGSTLTQVYAVWIQQEHKTNWHLAVVAHLDDAAKHIRGMYVRAAKYYPPAVGTITLSPYSGSSKNLICQERGCILGVGSVENPDQFHSYNYAMIHMSEVGRWGETAKKSANELAQALRPTVPDVPYSMIVMESTANGRGNFFHNEWVAATTGGSRYDPVFVAWWEIETYQRKIDDYETFIQMMDNHIMRDYLWGIWRRGGTLEGINWYLFIKKSENYSDLQMWRQFPSDAEESFSSTGRRVFSPMVLKKAEENCSPPSYKGQLFADGQKGKQAFSNLNFKETIHGELWIWDLPDTKTKMSNRYVVIVDIGGKSDGADYSTVRVLDRSYLLDAGCPEFIATWRGHLDQDLFAWVAVQIGCWYNNALVVIESNSIRKELAESEGDQFVSVLNEISNDYDNLYTRTDPAKIRQGLPVQWGFHMNVQTKPLVINALNAAWRDDLIVERDIRVMTEGDQFEFKDDGSMGAVDGAHDDLLIPTATGTWISQSYMDMPKILDTEYKKPKVRRKTEASL
jgi:hypothetical protein